MLWNSALRGNNLQSKLCRNIIEIYSLKSCGVTTLPQTLFSLSSITWFNYIYINCYSTLRASETFTIYYSICNHMHPELVFSWTHILVHHVSQICFADKVFFVLGTKAWGQLRKPFLKNWKGGQWVIILRLEKNWRLHLGEYLERRLVLGKMFPWPLPHGSWSQNKAGTPWGTFVYLFQEVVYFEIYVTCSFNGTWNLQQSGLETMFGSTTLVHFDCNYNLYDNCNNLSNCN